MQVYRNPPRLTWESLLQRPLMDVSDLEGRVGDIINEIRQKGDAALIAFAAKFDQARLSRLIVTREEIEKAEKEIEPGLKEAINTASANIEKFHAGQLPAMEKVITMEGVDCWRKAVPIEKVGLYIPGGTAPLFSTILMLGIPASIAGCNEIVLCTPPGKDGAIPAAIIYTATLVGITKIIKAGGAQAIAAMAFGTETVPRVNKIFGPGNQYVTCAKQLVQKAGVAIDLPAGPSEVAVFADRTANAAYVAADLLSQAEHGIDSQVLLVTTSEELIEAVEEQLARQVEELPRKEFALKALSNSRIILVQDAAEAMSLLNEYAPEHLILSCEDADSLAAEVINAGSVFLGHYSPESAGDYASGTNHTLPTNGYAKSYSGVSVDSFMKKITFQRLTEQGLAAIAPTIVKMAEAEGLTAHSRAVTIRTAGN